MIFQYFSRHIEFQGSPLNSSTFQACANPAMVSVSYLGPGPVAKSAARPIADSGAVSSILAQSHTFIKIDHEIFLTAIRLLPLIQEGLASVTS